MAPAGLPNYAKGYPPQAQPGQPGRPNTPPQGYDQQQGHHTPPQAQPQMQFDPFTGQPMHPSGPISQQMPHQQPMPMPMGMGPSGQYPQQQQPYYGQSGQYPQQYPQHDQSGQYAQSGGYAYPQQNGFAHGSGSGSQQNPMTTTGRGAAAIDPQGPKPEGRKKSSLGRDIAIGVVIAIVVLGGFLAVKFLILDKDDGPAPAPTTPSKIATLKISLPGSTDLKATLFVDDKEIGSFGDKGETMINAGTHKVKLVHGDEQCERELTLEGGKSAVFDCVMAKSNLGSAATGSGSATAETPAGSGSAVSPSAGSGSGSGSGSATQVAATDPPKTDDKTTKTDPPKTDPPKTDPPKTDPPKKDPPPKTDPKKDPPKTDPKKDKLPFEDKKPPPPPPAGDKDKGFLEVYSTKKAKILVDGVDTGLSTPISGKVLSLTPGRHKITFIVGEDRFTFPVTIKAGATETMRKELQ